MATNLQIGLAYVMGNVGETEHKLVNVGKVIGDERYNAYTLTMHEGVHDNKTYVLYKNLGNNESMRKLVEIDFGFKITRIIHIIEEVIIYDLKE